MTGLAIRQADQGDLVGSSSEDDVIYQISKTDGSLVDSYPMILGGTPYGHVGGDMTAGLLQLPPTDQCPDDSEVHPKYSTYGSCDGHVDDCGDGHDDGCESDYSRHYIFGSYRDKDSCKDDHDGSWSDKDY